MSNKTPWRLVGQTIRDAEGAVVVSAICPATMPQRRLIVEAVNQYAPRPRRNFDRFATGRDAEREWDGLMNRGRWHHDFSEWLFAPDSTDEERTEA